MRVSLLPRPPPRPPPVRDRRRRRHRRGSPAACCGNDSRRKKVSSALPPRSGTLPIRTFLTEAPSESAAARCSSSSSAVAPNASRGSMVDGGGSAARRAARAASISLRCSLARSDHENESASTSSRLSSISRRIAYSSRSAWLTRSRASSCAAPRASAAMSGVPPAVVVGGGGAGGAAGGAAALCRACAAASSRRSVSAGASPCAAGPARSDADSAPSAPRSRAGTGAGARIGVGATPDRSAVACSSETSSWISVSRCRGVAAASSGKAEERGAVAARQRSLKSRCELAVFNSAAECSAVGRAAKWRERRRGVRDFLAQVGHRGTRLRTSLRIHTFQRCVRRPRLGLRDAASRPSASH